MTHESPIWGAFWSDNTKFGSDKSHKNAWCLACVRQKAKDLKAENAIAVHSGHQPSLDLSPDKEEEHWLQMALSKIEPRAGKVQQLESHFEKCPHVNRDSDETKETAAAVLARREALLRKKAENLQNTASNLCAAAVGKPLSMFKENLGGQPMSSTASFSLPAPMFFSNNVPLSASSNMNIVAGSNITSEIEHSSADAIHVSKKNRTSHSLDSGIAVFNHPPLLHSVKQKDFEEDICRLFSACDIAWNVLDHPELKMFIHKWIPGAQVPDRRRISGEVLDKEVAKVISVTRDLVRGQTATYQCDGWKNVAKTPVITSKIMVRNKPHLVRTHDMRGRPKTGDELFKIFKADLDYIEHTYGALIKCTVTDDGPDGKKMRRLIREDRDLRIATFQCWGHQSSLLTGNYLSIKEPFMEAASKACDIIKWFNNHGKALDLFNRYQTQNSDRQQPLALITPSATRWTYQYMAFSRLSSLKRIISGCVALHEEDLLAVAASSREPGAQTQGGEAIQVCQEPTFWTDLERVSKHMEPLAVASNILQAPTCRLDHVLLTLGNLYQFFSLLPSEDATVTEKMHLFLEKRWKNTSQDYFILCTFFNPFIRTRYFNGDHLSKMDLLVILRYVAKSLNGTDPADDSEFISCFMEYYDETGRFTPMKMGCETLAKMDGFKFEDGTIDVAKIWECSIGTNSVSVEGRIGFVKLAITILRMVPNSASTECTFSSFGIVHTNRRNRLNAQKVHKQVMVHDNIMQAYQEAGVLPIRKKRKFGAEEPVAVRSVPPDASPNPDSECLNTNSDDFRTVASALVAAASGAEEDDNNENENEDDNDDNDATCLRANRAPASTSTATASRDVHARQRSTNIPRPFSITLSNLFDYSTEVEEGSGLAFQWNVARAWLEEDGELSNDEDN